MLRITCLLTLPVLLLAACNRRATPDAVGVSEPVQPVTAFDDANAGTRASRCEDQASRFAARGLWRERSAKVANDVLLRSTAHYSQKHGECDVLVEGRLTLANGVEIAYSELWDVFGATPLAAWTGDSRPDVRRGVCQIDLSDDPFVRCLVARYFIDDHMRH